MEPFHIIAEALPLGQGGSSSGSDGSRTSGGTPNRLADNAISSSSAPNVAPCGIVGARGVPLRVACPMSAWRASLFSPVTI
eukprot:7376939-Prymnesium_polylepis.1